MPYITIESNHIFYAHPQRQPYPTSLVLIHGAGGSHLDWPPEILRLPETAVYALDLPGHGRSAAPGRQTIDAYADDIIAILDALQLKNVILAGHSMGGAIAQTIALRQHPAVQGLVLIATGARLRVAPAILDNSVEQFDQVAALISKSVWGPNVDPALVEAGAVRYLENDSYVVQGDFLACNQFDLRDQLPTIQLPTLVIGAAADMMTPPKFSHYLAEHLPQGELLIFDNVGHFIPQEKPSELASAIQTFLHEHFAIA